MGQTSIQRKSKNKAPILSSAYQSIMDQGEDQLSGQKEFLNKMGSQSINPNDPLQVANRRNFIEQQSGGKYSIKTVDEMEGKGLSPGGINPQGLGYTVTESARTLRERDPNSMEARTRLQNQISSQKEDEMKRRNQIDLTRNKEF